MPSARSSGAARPSAQPLGVMTDPLSISYELVETGWSRCVVEAGEQRAELTASYVSDALGNLVLSALAAASGFHNVEFGFDEEPGEYRWSISTVESNIVRVRILEFPELWGNRPTDSGRLLFDLNITRPAFAKAVVACADAVLKECGLEGYAEQWVLYPFPTRGVELLRSVLAQWEAMTPNNSLDGARGGQ